jgi:magnesium/cobalt transport protein CorA
MHEPTEQEVAAVQETLKLGGRNAHRLREPPRSASVVDEGERMHVTLYAASGDGDAPGLNPVECVLGSNWIVTAYRQKVEVLEEFFERAQGGGQIGALDAPSLVATILDWIVVSYLRALDAVESELEELDAKIMSNTPKDAADDLSRLVELRRTIGTLRRALSPHREVVVSLSHPELDALSSEESAKRFTDLERRMTQALDAAREAKESTFGSFDLLVTRIGQRTNDIMKVLTLVTVILLPATVLGGIMGMNFQVGLFDQAWVFWVVIATMLGIAVVVLAVARARDWI